MVLSGAAVVALVLPTIVAAQEPWPLIPRPREVVEHGWLPLARGVTISAGAEDRATERDLTEALTERGVAVTAAGAGSVRIALHRASTPAGRAALRRAGVELDEAMREEGYALFADAAGRVDVVGATAAGVFYGAQTLKQLIDGEGARARLREVRIRDWPALRWRGFHDDLSRGPLPTLEFQKKQIRTLAAYKVNAYSPYFEHTLQYRSQPLIAPPGGALTREDARALVEYARRYHVTVIPEQEAFGHLHHVLKHEIYSGLGETPHGHVLAPGQPGSLPLIVQMFAEIDTIFPGPFIHLGADETFELGRGQTAGRVQTEGIGPVYLEFLKRIEAALRPLTDTGTRFLFWGDVAMNHPELVRTLPRDLIAVAWEYGQQPSFDRFVAPFRDAGMETWVAPGVSNWNRVYPNYAVALPNIQGFVRDGQRLGATGVLNTSWDDDGEALFAQTWYGVLFGAAAAWQSGESDIAAFQRSFGRIFHGDTTGAVDEAQRRLIAAHALLRQAQAGDASNFLFWVDPWSSEGVVNAGRLRPVAAQLRVLAESALVLIARARPGITREREALDAMELGARRIDLIGMKFQFADEIALAYDRAYRATTDADDATTPIRDLGDITGINGRFQDLRDAYSLLRDEYERAWLRENRPYWLRNVLARYDLATQLWLTRADRVGQARAQWFRTRKLPPASEVGVPPPPAPAP